MKPLLTLFMKRGVFLLFIILNSGHLYAQKEIEIKRENDKFNLLFKKSLSLDSSYQIKLTGVNPAHHILKVTAKSFELQTAQPEAFKDLLFLSGSLPPVGLKSDALLFTQASDISKYQDTLIGKMNRLEKLRKIADILYKQSKDTINKKSIDTAVDQISRLYGKLDTLPTLVGLDIHYINSSATYLAAYLLNNKNLDPDVANVLALSQYQTDQLKSKNYLEYAGYIISSNKLKDSGKKSLVSEPFITKKDLTEVRIILIDRYSKDTLYNNNQTFYNKGGSGISFSTGFFFTNGLTDNAYYLEKRSDGKMNIKTENKSRIDFSVGAFAQYYYKIDKMWRLGPGLGIAVSPFDGKPRYLVGLSTLIGKEKMVGVSTGIAWAKVKQLSGSVLNDNEGPFLPAETTTVPTFEKFRPNFFIGLTYNVVATRK